MSSNSTVTESRAQHTPLPWGMVYGTDGHHHIFAGDGPIAVVSVRADADEQQANALVLLCAVELLQACELFTAAAHEVRDLLNGRGLACPSSIAFAAEKARNAIARAEDRS